MTISHEAASELPRSSLTPQDATARGESARRNRDGQESCPYPEGTEEAEEWREAYEG